MDAIGAQHVRDFVRISNHSRGAVGEDGSCELVHHQLGRFDVHVCIDKAGHEIGIGHVDALVSLIVAEADHVAVFDGDVDVEPFLREDREHVAAGQHQVGRFVTPRYCDPPCVDEREA